MEIVWSRWLLGARAAIAVVWLALAMLLLVQTWPEPSPDRQMLWGHAGEEPTALRAGAAASGAVKEHVRSYLLFALIPPGFLLALICFGLWAAGLPFPSLRRTRRDKLSSSG